MSGSTQQLRRKISGANDLGGVVRAMKALAASSVGQYERAVESLDDYLRAIDLAITACLHETGPATPVPGKQRHQAETIGAIVFGSDQGLVGSFNEVIVDFSVKALRALPGKVTRIWAVGERAHSLLTETNLCPVTQLSVPGTLDAITPLVGELLLQIESAREKGDAWEVQFFHNHPKRGSAYEPAGNRLLPLDKTWQDQRRAEPWPSKCIPQVMDGVPSALAAFLREYLFVLLFQACAESLASENASRLAAMQRAEKNIDSMVGDLNRQFHRLRQSAIDEELFDVISGFEALTGSSQK